MCNAEKRKSANLVLDYKSCQHLGYVHTVTFSHRFLLFGSKLEFPWDCGTIQSHAKTLPCARSLTLKPGAHETILVVRFLLTDQIVTCTASIFTRFSSADRNRSISNCFDITSEYEPIKIGRLKSGRVRLALFDIFCLYIIAEMILFLWRQ